MNIFNQLVVCIVLVLTLVSSQLYAQDIEVRLKLNAQAHKYKATLVKTTNCNCSTGCTCPEGGCFCHENYKCTSGCTCVGVPATKGVITEGWKYTKVSTPIQQPVYHQPIQPTYQPTYQQFYQPSYQPYQQIYPTYRGRPLIGRGISVGACIGGR